MKAYEDLKWRGLIQDVSSPEIEDLLNNKEVTFYIGTDPTADSMHIGHFSSFLLASRLKKYGHHPIILIGGATGLIGDPKPTIERPMITKEQVEKNVKGLSDQAKKIFGCEVVNNYEWCKEINFLDFLRDYGKYFNVNYMINKDIIKRRLESGITYTEFSYMIIQSLDFLHLNQTKGVTLQVAGSDQWGNITSGIELIRKKTGKEVYALTMPLITDSRGVKFGKTEGNAIWLDKQKTSPYEMYQFLVNVEDESVIDYLKKLTFLSKEEIEKIESDHKQTPEKRLAQKSLAKSIISFIHGDEAYKEAQSISEALFSGNVKDITDKQIETSLKSMETIEIDVNKTIIDILVDSKINSSKREAREFLKAKAITLNGEIINEETLTLNKQRKYNILRKGKKRYYILKQK